MARRRRERRRWGQTEAERDAAAERARRQARLEAEMFLLGADAYTFTLIERFGIPAVRSQLAANATAYRAECERMERAHARRTMAEALALARERPAPSFRIVLYRENRRAQSDLAKLGVVVEYVNPNGAGDS